MDDNEASVVWTETDRLGMETCDLARVAYYRSVCGHSHLGQHRVWQFCDDDLCRSRRGGCARGDLLADGHAPRIIQTDELPSTIVAILGRVICARIVIPANTGSQLSQLWTT